MPSRATTYVACAPEAGKVADGAADGWEWLCRYTTWQVLGFWHAAQ